MQKQTTKIKYVSVSKILLDQNNYRHTPQPDQQSALLKTISEQKRKLVVLAKDIIEHGLSPHDFPIIVPSPENNKKYIVVEGNRRLTALKLLLKPDLAKGTTLYNSFKLLQKSHEVEIPTKIYCTVLESKKEALIWIDRKHSNSLGGKGTEQWNAMSKARSDIDQGINHPEIEILDWIMEDENIQLNVAEKIENNEFNITTLERLIYDNYVQEKLGIKIQNRELFLSSDEKELFPILSEIVTIIALGEDKNGKFTVRKIDSSENIKFFIDELLSENSTIDTSKPLKKVILTKRNSNNLKNNSNSSTPLTASKPANTKSQTTTPIDKQKTLIPSKFSVQIPAGKINDLFNELKKLDVNTYRNVTAVAFRVFLEHSVDHYIKTSSIHVAKEQLIHKLISIRDHLLSNHLIDKNQLKTLNTVISDTNSICSTETLNAYVHNPLLPIDALTLKLAWQKIEFLMEIIWKE